MKLTLENIFYKYNKNQEYALENINLTLTSSLTYIVGENGSGKTTLINLLNGIYKPSSGCILLNDVNISNIKTLKKDVSIVYQFSDNQFFNLTVKEDLLYSFKKDKEKIDQALKEIEYYFSLFKLPLSLLDTLPFLLSGGEKKKIAIISSLILKPKILILDEPTIGLDNETKLSINETLKKLSDDIFVIVISHNFDEVYKYAKDIVYMQEGEIKLFENNYTYFKLNYNSNDMTNLPELLRVCKYLNLDYDKAISFESQKQLKSYILGNMKDK